MLFISCSGGGAKEIVVGDFTITDFNLYTIHDTASHITFTLTCTSDIMIILSSMDLTVEGGRRTNLLKHQTFAPGTSMMIYRRDLPVSAGSTLILEAIIGGEINRSKPFPADPHMSDTTVEKAEETLGAKEFERFLGKTY